VIKGKLAVEHGHWAVDEFEWWNETVCVCVSITVQSLSPVVSVWDLPDILKLCTWQPMTTGTTACIQHSDWQFRPSVLTVVLKVQYRVYRLSSSVCP